MAEYVEFASREWNAEARRYLEEQAQSQPEALAGVEWSITERWRNAPPHLGWAGDVAGFSIRVNGGVIAVGSGPAAEAETEVDGDYNAVLPIAWTIYGGDAAVQQRAAREYGALAGEHGPRMSGAFPGKPELLAALGGLHDHMARRTINNPDVEHRIEHYGLRAHVEELSAQGRTSLRNAFTAELAVELREHGGSGRHGEEMAVHPWLLTLVDSALGAGAVLIRPEPGALGEGVLTAAWVLVDDAVPGVKLGDIVVSVGAAVEVQAEGALCVCYAGPGARLGERRVEFDEERLERNPPVLRALCG